MEPRVRNKEFIIKLDLGGYSREGKPQPSQWLTEGMVPSPSDHSFPSFSQTHEEVILEFFMSSPSPYSLCLGPSDHVLRILPPMYPQAQHGHSLPPGHCG